jgi:hypothetical protein
MPSRAAILRPPTSPAAPCRMPPGRRSKSRYTGRATSCQRCLRNDPVLSLGHSAVGPRARCSREGRDLGWRRYPCWPWAPSRRLAWPCWRGRPRTPARWRLWPLPSLELAFDAARLPVRAFPQPQPGLDRRAERGGAAAVCGHPRRSPPHGGWPLPTSMPAHACSADSIQLLP